MVVGLAALTYALGFAAILITPPGSGVAIWWPAAGVSVLLYLLYRGPRWQALAYVGLLGFASNIAVGRPLSFALTDMVILMVEVWVVAWVLGRDGQRTHLGSMRGLGRFLLAVMAGAVTIGIEGAATLYWLVGLDPLASFGVLVLSHGSALVLIVPVALVPISRQPLRVRPSRAAEGIVQFAATMGFSLVVFSPTLPAPMLFTIFPLLAWAAARFRPLFVVVQLLAIALLVPTLAVLNGGPSGSAQGVIGAGLYVQLFMISSAVTMLFLSVTRSERDDLADDKERRAALLRGGFIGAQVGFLILQRHRDGGLRVLEANEVGEQMVRGHWLEPVIDEWLVSDVPDLNRELTLADGRSYQVFGSRTKNAHGERAVGVQLVEITQAILAREALARTAESERTVANELRELSRQKDDFVSAVSHELRTPITSILGFAEELEESGPDDTRQAADVIVRNSRRLADMVEQLLELGRMTAAKQSQAPGEASLDPIVANTAEEQQLTADSGRVSLELVLGTGNSCVAVDSATLGRIVTNLLSNAIKFTPSGGRVRMSTTVTGDSALLHVDDSGVGISPADRTKVFDRFFRSVDDAKLATPGTGLGLAIVRSLVEESGGQIAIEDSPLGGTRMSVILPLVSVTQSGDTDPDGVALATP